MTIHNDHPFRDPDPDQVRRLRARVGATVSLWTAGVLGEDAAGLTVSSYLIATGEPGHLVGAIDPDSELAERLRASERAVVCLLDWGQRELAEMFGGTLPAPGGLFAQADFVDTEFGPRLADARAWAGCRLVEERELGWSSLFTLAIAEVVVGETEEQWLVHRAGRFHRDPGTTS